LNNVRFAEEDTLLDDPKMQDPFYAKHNINRETITEESESARTGYVEDSFYIQDDYLDDIYL